MDSVYLNKKNIPCTKEDYKYLVVTYDLKDTLYKKSIIYTNRGKNIAAYELVDSIGKVFFRMDIQADYSGSASDYYWFFKKNIKNPAELKKIKEKIFFRILVILNEDGSLNKIVNVDSSEECQACKEEAIRVIKLYPKWKPGRFDDTPVKSYYFVYVSFEDK